jgi:HK97 family phage major capsid protein
VAAKTEITRRMMKQASSSISLDELVAQDLRAAMGLAVDLAALHGTGASGQPTGVSATGSIGGVTTGGAITITHIVDFLTDLAAGNALMGALGFFTRAAVWGILKRKEKATNTGIFLCDDSNRVEGYPVFVTEQVSANNLFFGNWNEILIALWGGIDLFADPYSGGDNGLVRVRAYQTADIGVRHAASFSLATDVTG